MLIIAVIAALATFACLVGAIHHSLLALGNATPGISVGRLFIWPGNQNPDLYTAVGRRHLNRYYMFVGAMFVGWPLTVWLFVLAARARG